MLSLVFIIISKIVKRKTKKLRKRHNIQEGKITYSDLNKPEKPLFSKRYRITGKPDYIVRTNKHYIPVEFKTGTHNKPQKNHIFQLAGYCQLLEDNYGSFVPYGILVYNDEQQYKIPYDPKIRFELESTITSMRRIMKTGRIERNHCNYYRCKSCSMITYCDVKIA